MSSENVLKTLANLGLTQIDAELYIFLAKRGPIEARNVAKALKISKQRVYPIIKKLQSKGILNSTLEHPARFSVIPFEKLLDLFIRTKMEEAQRVKQEKNGILQDWKSIVVTEISSSPAQFTVIEGRHYVYSKIQQMIQETKKEFSFVTTVPGLARADTLGLFDAAFNHPLRSKIRFRFITELSKQNTKAIKAILEKKPKVAFNLEGRIPDLGLKLSPRMVIRDEEETVFFIDPIKENSAIEQDDVCLWTNCKSLAHAFSTMFDELWRNATDIEQKIAEIEDDKPTPKTYIINDAKTAQTKYYETLYSTNEEIIMMTSSEGLIESGKDIALLKKWVGKGVSVRIMAPIIRENLQCAQELSHYCTVKHVPVSYLKTTIIDGKHLFQFRNKPPDQKKSMVPAYFGHTFYTSDLEYVEKTRTMLNDVWKNTTAPSTITLDSLLKPPIPSVPPLSDNEYAFSKPDSPYKRISHGVEEKPEVITEKDVLNKIINAKKYSGDKWPNDIMRYYGSTATAIIHPPDYLNLAEMIIWVMHYNKQSSFGAEDLLEVLLWLETPKGYAYVPVALVTDNHRTLDFWKTTFAGTPAGKNCQLVKKGEFQIRVHSNIIFAGWTEPIPLLPKSLTLPPSCLLFEGYSKLKTGILQYGLPSGVRVSADYNGFDAFVTYFHPLSKYSGPGTDGVLGRDVITTLHPPQPIKK